VTVEHLLAHRSGIGDYLDESVHEVLDYVLAVPVHTLADSNDYLAILDGHPQRFRPGERFAYNNAGFVVLALLVERATQTAFVDLVRQLVCDPANMKDTDYTRSVPERTALGYLHAEGHQGNVLHLPVRGSGDGGAYTTLATSIAFGPRCVGVWFSIEPRSPRRGSLAATLPVRASATVSASGCTRRAPV